MSDVGSEWVDNAVAAIQAEYTGWTVQPYNGSIPPETSDTPLVTVAIEGVRIIPEEDRMTGETFGRASVVCYVAYPRTRTDSFKRALASSLGLLAFLRIQPLHEKADFLFPEGVDFIPEEINGRPVTQRSLWSVTGNVVLILDSDVADSDAFNWTVVGQPLRDVNVDITQDVFTGEDN